MRTSLFALLSLLFLGLISVTPPSSAQPAQAGLHPRSLDDIKKTLAAIAGTPPQGDGLEVDRELALRRLRAYRYLAEVPYQNLTLDSQCNQLAQASANICAKLGRTTHEPTNPGLPEAEFKLAAKGAAGSNLGKNYKSLVSTIDGYMNDSDPKNISKVAHRRWCLNPPMLKTGFGQVEKFYGMWAIDKSNLRFPDYDVICYPARGYMPIEFFRASYAWSVTPNPAKFKFTPQSVKPSIWAADAKGNKQGDPLPLTMSTVNGEVKGIPPCIIFQPTKIEFKLSQCYLVEIAGLTFPGRSTPLRYLVEFVSLQ